MSTDKQQHNRIVVLVPGIGLGGIELAVLAWRLRRQGCHVIVHYRNPWRRTLTANTQALAEALRSLPAGEVPDLVGHSLGGPVILQMLRDFPDIQVKRIVTLGSPLTGCLAGARVSRFLRGSWFIGPALRSVADGHAPLLQAGVEVGSIAGRINLLFGYLLCPGKQNDTLVCVEETQPTGLTAHTILPVTHTSMLVAGSTADNVIRFLETGNFGGGESV